MACDRLLPFSSLSNHGALLSPDAAIAGQLAQDLDRRLVVERLEARVLRRGGHRRLDQTQRPQRDRVLRAHRDLDLRRHVLHHRERSGRRGRGRGRRLGGRGGRQRHALRQAPEDLVELRVLLDELLAVELDVLVHLEGRHAVELDVVLVLVSEMHYGVPPNRPRLLACDGIDSFFQTQLGFVSSIRFGRYDTFKRIATVT